jgi:phage shock protein PspC (stress-responsive transcriptional regulator)
MPAKKHTTPNESHNNPTPTERLYRSETNKVLGGVAGGVGEYTNIDPTIIRIVFVILTIFGGSGVLLYVVLWIVLPSHSTIDKNSDYIRDNLDEIKGHARSFSHSMKLDHTNSRRSWGAFILIGLGILLVINNFGFFRVDFDKLWPFILIGLGILILRRK